MAAAAGIILLLIALTAVYVAAEYGAVGVRRSRLRRLCEDGHATAATCSVILGVAAGGGNRSRAAERSDVNVDAAA